MNKEKKIFLGFAALTLIIYGQSLFGGFVFDDRGIAEHLELWTGIDKIIQVASYPYWTVDAGLYRPTTLLSYLFNSVLLGHGAFGFHLVNLALYWGIGVLTYLVLKRLFNKELFAILAAVMFLALPIHTEVVANISGRSELLALFCSLLTLLEFTRDKVRPWQAGLWMLLAIGSKETAVATLPLAALALFVQQKPIFIRAMFGAVAGAGIYFFLRFLVLPGHFLGVETSIIENPLLFVSASERITTTLAILWMYIQKTFWPFGLCSDYSYNQIPAFQGFFHTPVLLGAVVLIGAVVLFFTQFRKRPIISFASAIFLLSFIPVSNLLFPIGTIAGERLFFFPSLGIVILGAYLLTPSASGTSPLLRGRLVGVSVLIIFYAFLAFNRQSVWLSEERLFLSAVECSPKSVLSLSNAGTVYYFRGDYKTAAKYLEESRAIRPVYSKGLNNLGLVYWKDGRPAEAMNMYHAALMQKYPYLGTIENLALLYASQGDEAGVLRWLRIAYPNVGDSALRSLF